MTAFGMFTPVILVGAITSVLGCILLNRLNAVSLTEVWVGSQLLAGFGLGLAFQTPLLAAQALASDEDLTTTTAILVCEYIVCHCWNDH